jgi:hypothetical protein
MAERRVVVTPITNHTEIGRHRWFGLIDNYEPAIIIGGMSSLVGVAYSIMMGLTGWSVVTGIATVSAVIAEWRVRTLGVARDLMESVDVLKAENLLLRETREGLAIVADELRHDHYVMVNMISSMNETQVALENEAIALKSENDRFVAGIALLGGEMANLSNVKEQFLELYEQVRGENFRQEANNLLSLFFLLDKNHNSVLDENEVENLQGYLEIVYGSRYDFSRLDRDGDGAVSLAEFFNKFRER